MTTTTTTRRKARNGEGSVYRQRGRKGWTIAYSNAAGERIVEGAGTRDYTKALTLLQQRTGAVAGGEQVTKEQTGRRAWTFDEAVAEYLTVLEINGKPVRYAYGTYVERHLLPVFGGQRLDMITAGMVATYAAGKLREKRKGGATYSRAYVNIHLGILKSTMRLAVKRGHLRTCPSIELLAADNARKGFFTREQFDAVYRHLPAYWRGAMMFGFHTGWRMASEILQLEWRHVDREAGVIKLDPGETKNGRGRLFPYAIVPELKAAIDEADRVRKAAAKRGEIIARVFHNNGRPLTTRAYATLRAGRIDNNPLKDFNAACIAAGVVGRKPHDFRRTCARNLTRAGVPRGAAMQLIGMKTDSIFRRYDIVEEAELFDAAERYAAGMATPRAARR